ncbi:MAG: hypothetical protein FD170_308 [Bacteroidetes bacterium]|nr:MAG: hypothetical protein FD170_308 [Bacteroidota bacterium]
MEQKRLISIKPNHIFGFIQQSAIILGLLTVVFLTSKISFTGYFVSIILIASFVGFNAFFRTNVKEVVINKEAKTIITRRSRLLFWKDDRIFNGCELSFSFKKETRARGIRLRVFRLQHKGNVVLVINPAYSLWSDNLLEILIGSLKDIGVKEL